MFKRIEVNHGIKIIAVVLTLLGRKLMCDVPPRKRLFLSIKGMMKSEQNSSEERYVYVR